jgi:hypothetical protein
VLDCFFWKSRGGSPDAASAATAFLSPDPGHDYQGVWVALRMVGMDTMPPTESLQRPLRLNMQGWALKRSEWQQAVQVALTSPVGMAENLPNEPSAHLEHRKRVALHCARRVLGESGGTVRRLIPHHSEVALHLMLLKVVWQELHSRQKGVPKMQSRAMRRLWDAGVYPSPADFGSLSTLWSSTHQGRTESWLRMLRHQSRRNCMLCGVQSNLRRKASEQSRQAAIAL